MVANVATVSTGKGGGSGVFVTGCSACFKRFGTVNRLVVDAAIRRRNGWVRFLSEARYRGS